MTDTQRKLGKWGKRDAISRWFHADDGKESIAILRIDLGKILQVYDMRSAV